MTTTRVFFLLAALSSAMRAEEPKPRDQRPNFLFVLTDDQRWDAMGAVQREQGESGRFPWFETPNMDRLAREGIRFRNAFVVNALCSPSRACYLTGWWVHVVGAIGRDRRLTLHVDGVAGASGTLPGFNSRDPSDGMQIGTDEGSPVADYKGQRGFVGLIESVKVFSGERSAEELRADAEKLR